jgi:hypothetical protein
MTYFTYRKYIVQAGDFVNRLGILGLKLRHRQTLRGGIAESLSSAQRHIEKGSCRDPG